MKPYTGKVIICTQFYELRAWSPFLVSLVVTIGALSKLGIEWDFWEGSEWDAENASNKLFTRFIDESDATDLLWIDSDQEWRAEDAYRILGHAQPIVAATYPMKNQWGHYAGTDHLVRENGVPTGVLLGPDDALLLTEKIPCGFARYKRAALQAFVKAYPERYDSHAGSCYTIWQRGIHDGKQELPDYRFSRMWRELGGELFIDPKLRVGHIGVKRWEGDFDKHLRDKVRELDAFAIVEQMAKEIEARQKAA